MTDQSCNGCIHNRDGECRRYPKCIDYEIGEWVFPPADVRCGEFTQEIHCDDPPDSADAYDLIDHIERQWAWSFNTFGPEQRTAGIIAHIRKELAEIEAEPQDVEEWVDVIILAIEGAWRRGFSPSDIARALRDKLAKNMARVWPDWRTVPEDRPIEHVKEPVDGC